MHNDDFSKKIGFFVVCLKYLSKVLEVKFLTLEFFENFSESCLPGGFQ